jgi:hypothetical protein
MPWNPRGGGAVRSGPAVSPGPEDGVAGSGKGSSCLTGEVSILYDEKKRDKSATLLFVVLTDKKT